jgi:uncharacterized membrane protein
MKKLLAVVVVFFLVLGVVAANNCALAQNYSVDTINGLKNNLDPASDINESGQISGWYAYGGGAFFYDPVNGVKDIGALGSEYGAAWGINDLGQVVGSAMLSATCPTASCAFIWVGTQPMG